MKPKLSLLIYRICFAAGIVILLGSIVLFNTMSARRIGVFAGLGVELAGAIQANIFYKCPHCGKPINPRGKQPAKCLNCEKEIKW